MTPAYTHILDLAKEAEPPPDGILSRTIFQDDRQIARWVFAYTALLFSFHVFAMLLTITTTHQPATDLGYLLHKHPDRFQSFNLSFGQAHVFYPEVSEGRTTAALCTTE